MRNLLIICYVITSLPVAQQVPYFLMTTSEVRLPSYINPLATECNFVQYVSTRKFLQACNDSGKYQ